MVFNFNSAQFCQRGAISASVARFAFVPFGAFVALVAGGAIAGCGNDDAPAAQPPPALDAGPELQHARVTATVGSTKFTTREHFLAGGEMQISGEPFAESMGRDLTGYSRDHLPTNIYFDPSATATGPWIDLTGFSTAVESYEYSKQPMNFTALESGAGTSLAHGPLVNPLGIGGAQGAALLAAKVQHFAVGANTLGRFVFAPGTFPVNSPRGGDLNALGTGLPIENPLGWPGLWPTVHVFRSFDPTVHPTGDLNLGCSITSDDDPGAGGGLDCADYECDATTMHLFDRKSQIEPIVSPGADGFSAWKYGLWVLNYLQVMHDSGEAAVTTVASDDLAHVGDPANQIVGADDTGAPTAAGTFLGSSDIEGFQAQMFIEEMDNRAQDWIFHLSTADGTSLSGFPTIASALAYDYAQPLRWFPSAIAVTETDDGSGFPKPAYALSSPDSSLLDQVGLVMGYSEFYSLTDKSNADVGGSQPAIAYFDGDPFKADNQTADGEDTLHDRALAILRVALIDIDRLHADPASNVLVDDVKMTGNVPARAPLATTTSLAYAIIGIRTALRAMGSTLELYSNNTPDIAVSRLPLDAAPTHAPGASSLGPRLLVLLQAQGDLLLTQLTDATGRAWSGWNVATAARIDDQDLLDSHTAAVRGLFATYLVTGDVRYRDRAMLVWSRMQSVFYDADARIYALTPAPATTVEYTPLRFALLQSAMRDVYELMASRPGGEALVPMLEDRIARLNKLVLNGWDDRNQNRVVDYPDECVNIVDRLPRGGLQMAERTLTGETGSLFDKFQPGQTSPTADRESDCVPEVDDAKLPAALADSITFTVVRP